MTEFEFWEKFVKENGLDPDSKYDGVFGFEAQGFFGAERIAALLAGKKRAAFFPYSSYVVDDGLIPVSGEHYIILGAGRQPVCVIQTTRVQVVPFDQVTMEMVSAEGEDSSVEEWRQKTREILEDECLAAGISFAPDIKLVYMEFEVVFRS